MVEVFAQQVQFLGLCAADDYSALWLARAVLDPGRQIPIGEGVLLLVLDGYCCCAQFDSACLAACEHERSLGWARTFGCFAKSSSRPVHSRRGVMGLQNECSGVMSLAVNNDGFEKLAWLLAWLNVTPNLKPKPQTLDLQTANAQLFTSIVAFSPPLVDVQYFA